MHRRVGAPWFLLVSMTSRVDPVVRPGSKALLLHGETRPLTHLLARATSATSCGAVVFGGAGWVAGDTGSAWE